MTTDRMTIGGRSYLRGRKMNGPALAFLAARDVLIGPFFKSKKVPLPQGSDLTQICVCQIDHLGDLLILTPFLIELRNLAPQARITLVVGQWCSELAEVLRAGGLVDECIIYTAWLMDSSRRNILTKMFGSWRTLFSAARKLRVKKLDVFFDLRPWSPNAWLLAHLSCARLRVGYGLRGMADVYNYIPAFPAEKSIGQIHLDALQVFTEKKCVFTGPVLPPVPNPLHLNLPTSDYLVAQLFSRDAAKNIPNEIWKDFLLRLARRWPVVLVGAPVDAERAGCLIELPGVISLIGRTSICDMLGVIQQSQGVVSIDSFGSHAGLGYDKKVAVLMVEDSSYKRAFPENNPNLKFVPAKIESSEAIELFFSNSLRPSPNAPAASGRQTDHF
jgi:ADP-heptose:LPS heptosyltransferase